MCARTLECVSVVRRLISYYYFFFLKNTMHICIGWYLLRFFFFNYLRFKDILIISEFNKDIFILLCCICALNCKSFFCSVVVVDLIINSSSGLF